MYNLTATNWSKIKPFYVEFGVTRLYGDMVSKQADEIPHLLCLPGTSQAGRSEFALMRQLLLSQFGLASCAFDFIQPLVFDEPTTTGLMAQCVDIIEACFDSQPFSIVAVEQSSELAWRLIEIFPVTSLILLNATLEIPALTIPYRCIRITGQPEQTLNFINSHPILLLKTVTLIRDTLAGDTTPVLLQGHHE